MTRQKLRLELLVAGDLDREIRWIHSSDMPDPAPYLRGGEVVLTAGIWYWHGVAPSTFAAGLGHANAAALGFGTSPLVSEVPAELVDACEEWGLTLFRVPEGVAFIEIAEEFVEAQHRDRERPLLDSLDRSGQFLYTLQAGGGWACCASSRRSSGVVSRSSNAGVEPWSQVVPCRRSWWLRRRR